MPQEYDYKGNATWYVRVDTHENGGCLSYERPHIHCRKGGSEYRLRIDGPYCGDFIGQEARGKDRDDLISIAYKYKVYCNDLYLDFYEEIDDTDITYTYTKKILI